MRAFEFTHDLTTLAPHHSHTSARSQFGSGPNLAGSFFNSYEGLKGAYAARGAASDQSVADADAKMREILKLLQPAKEGVRRAQEGRAEGRIVRVAGTFALLERFVRCGRWALMLLRRGARRLPRQLLPRQL